MDLSFQQVAEIVSHLTPAEKLKLNDMMWNDDMDIPIEHQKLVLERIQKSKSNPERMLDWNGSKSLE